MSPSWGENLPNHGYVDLTLVGSPDLNDGDHSVQCHTDLMTCCSGGQGRHRGDWYFPDGDRLLFSGDSPRPDIYMAREAQQVDLRRRNNANLPSGIYRCDIPTNSVLDEDDISVRDTVYVGVYAIGGIAILKCVCLFVAINPSTFLAQWLCPWCSAYAVIHG